MSLRRFNPCFGLSRRTGAIAVSCLLLAFALPFTVLCFSQLSAGSTLPNGTQGALAIAGMLQVVLVVLASTIIFASWKENTRLICFSAYFTPIHLALNLIVLICLLIAVAPAVPCTTGRSPCSKLVAPKPAWSAISVLIFAAQLYLSVVVFSYFLNMEDSTRRSYVSSRSISAIPARGSDHKHLLSNSEPYHNADMDAVESGTTTHSLLTGAGYGGGMRSYDEAEGNEKARLRQEMEDVENQTGSFQGPSMSEFGVLTPHRQEWRGGDLPPYTP